MQVRSRTGKRRWCGEEYAAMRVLLEDPVASHKRHKEPDVTMRPDSLHELGRVESMMWYNRQDTQHLGVRRTCSPKHAVDLWLRTAIGSEKLLGYTFP